MIYKKVKEGTFIARPNRFIAIVEVDGIEEVCHVKNTGRCKELLIPGVTVFLEESDNPARKTKYDLIAVYKGDKLFNIDSSAPNKVFSEWLHEHIPNAKLIKPECTYKNSRFDFYVEADKKTFIEVKGVTLERDGVMLFPDAPTERGVKHINELIECKNEGYDAYIAFIVQADFGEYFTPNRETHKAFAEALIKAEKAGVKIICLNCNVAPNELKIKEEIPVKL